MGGFGVRGIGLLSLSVLALAGCMDGQTKVVAQPAAHNSAKPDKAQDTRKAAAARAAKVKANELGQIPVLMYHRVVAKPAGTDDRTPQQFRTELERLAKDGYVPITAREYTTGKIAIPAGTHPVVLTFDDSSPSQLTLDGTGAPKPDTAVGILLDVSRKHPGFRPVATFYVIKDMFGTFGPEAQAQVLGWLHDNNFDIGNHTRDHLNLRGRSKEQVTEQITAGHKLITSLIKDTPSTLALPYGNQPSTKTWAIRGGAGDVRYDYTGVFLAGYTPGASPFSKDFDPLGIPRIRAMDKVGDCARFCSTAWLDWLNAHPEDRYTSDGDISTVAYPKFKSPYVTPRFARYTLPY
ncbi:polysaccharide deacetylase family protein [Sphaerisporangium corydalis]|uniref:Polysaccharide deacetylase family protein n=1 Tax=Sphaerisporangium corydalis TaxID=1441875 RepID=A0ABV9ET42_9ACTN|nr:polysaccharide deacetylase family protein [Sphaerisporangium corydalis]